MARTRAAAADGRGGRGGRGDPPVHGGRGDPPVRRGRATRGGRGGRGAGEADPAAAQPQNPEVAAIFNQMFADLLPNIVAQVAAVVGGNAGAQAGANEPGNVPVEPEGAQAGDVVEPAVPYNPARVAQRQERAEYRQGCTFADFKKCGPQRLMVRVERLRIYSGWRRWSL